MGRRVMLVVFGLLFSLGAVLLTWMPAAKSFAGRAAREAEIQAYERAVGRIGEECLEKHSSLARWYNHALHSGASEGEMESAYCLIGNLGQGIMGWIEVPSLYWRIPLYHWGEGEMGAWHHKHTSFPLGIPGQASAFSVAWEWDLNRLEAGMEVWVRFLGERRQFRVASSGEPAEWTLSDLNGRILVPLVPAQGQNVFLRREEGVLLRCMRGVLGAWALPLAGEVLRLLRSRTGRKRSKKRKKLHYI